LQHSRPRTALKSNGDFWIIGENVLTQARPRLGSAREKFDGAFVAANVSSLKLLIGKIALDCAPI
jgi:hypothetical protein